MRCSAKSIYSLPMTAMLLTAALVIPVVAAPAVPFRGSVQAVENLNVQFPMIFVDASGGGNATQTWWERAATEHWLHCASAERVSPSSSLRMTGAAAIRPRRTPTTSTLWARNAGRRRRAP
jgi:hypothetical protein